MSHTHRQRPAYLLLLIAMVCSTRLGGPPPPQAGYSLFSNPTGRLSCDYTVRNNVSLWQRREPTFPESTPFSPSVGSFQHLYWTHGLQAKNSTGDSLVETFLILQEMLRIDGTIITLHDSPRFEPIFHTIDCFSVFEICKPRYHCLINTLRADHRTIESLYLTCLAQNFNITREEERSSVWRCDIVLESFTRFPGDCEPEGWDLTQENWELADTDRKLQLALQGGVGSDGINWVARPSNTTLAETFGRQF